MPSIGPQLPPELQRRKRSRDEDDADTSDSSTGPAPPPRSDKETSPPSTKRTRVIGPAPPPAPLNERPPDDPESRSEVESEDDDDDFGPSLPSRNNGTARPSTNSSVGTQVAPTTSVPPATRDEWMTLAPVSGDWSTRVDPTKLKGRKFQTGKGAKAPSQAGTGGDASWHENPEQKQERLKREVLGIKDTSTSTASSRPAPAHNAHDDATARRLKEYSETQRGPSLYANHTATQDKPVDDDPSARAFDREKDIGSGSAITATKRREMVKKATDFSSKFEKARYL